MATTSSVGDVPVEFQLPRQGGARRGGHDDGGDDLVVLPPGGATPHAAREASQLRRSFFKSDLGATTAMSRCEHSLKLSKKEVIAIGRPRAPARENPAGIDAGERVGTTARRRSGASPRPDAYRVAARPAPPPLPSARRGLPSAHRAPRTPRQGRDERDRKPRHSVRRAASGQHRNRGSNSNVRSCGQKQALRVCLIPCCTLIFAARPRPKHRASHPKTRGPRVTLGITPTHLGITPEHHPSLLKGYGPTALILTQDSLPSLHGRLANYGGTLENSLNRLTL